MEGEIVRKQSDNALWLCEKAQKAYLSSCRANGLAEGTVANYERITSKYLEFVKENGYEEATISSVNDWKISLSESGMKITTLNFYLGVLKTYFDFAVSMEMLFKSPIIPVVMPSKKAVNTEKKKPYKHNLDEADFALILYGNKPKGVSELNWKRNKAILVMLMTTALRNSELRDLKLKDLDFEEGTVCVEKGKGNKERLAAFPSVAQEVIKEYIESGYRPNNLGENDYLFGTNEDGWKQFDRFTLSQLIERNIKLCTGKEGYRSHSLRHYAATFYYDKGVDMASISGLLGHTSQQTTSIYIEKLRPKLPTQKANSVFDEYEKRGF